MKNKIARVSFGKTYKIYIKNPHEGIYEFFVYKTDSLIFHFFPEYHLK